MSLGYFQPISAVRAQSRFDGLAVIRRQTGGGAICHHHELTYALALPAGHPLARPSTQLYRAAHDAIVQSLAELGVTAKRRDSESNDTVREQKRSLLCFTDASADDIVTVGTKIVGSAQRRRRGAVLQHGSILWARSCWAPELIGVCDVADVSVQPSDWSSRVLSAISNALNLISQPTCLSERVRLCAARWSMFGIVTPCGPRCAELSRQNESLEVQPPSWNSEELSYNEGASGVWTA